MGGATAKIVPELVPLPHPRSTARRLLQRSAPANLTHHGGPGGSRTRVGRDYILPRGLSYLQQ
eukprot:8380584-Pyramimonas_sp.AAC.1